MKVVHNSVEYDLNKHDKVVDKLGGIDNIIKKCVESNLFGEQYYLKNVLFVNELFEQKIKNQKIKISVSVKPKLCKNFGGYINDFLFENSNEWLSYTDAIKKYPLEKYFWEMAKNNQL